MEPVVNLRRWQTVAPQAAVSTGELARVLETGRDIAARDDLGVFDVIAARTWGDVALSVISRSNANPVCDGSHDIMLGELGVLMFAVSNVYFSHRDSERVTTEAIGEARRRTVEDGLPDGDDMVLFEAASEPVRSAGVIEQIVFDTTTSDTGIPSGWGTIVTGPRWAHSFLARHTVPRAVGQRCSVAPTTADLIGVVKALCERGLTPWAAAEIVATLE